MTLPSTLKEVPLAADALQRHLQALIAFAQEHPKGPEEAQALGEAYVATSVARLCAESDALMLAAEETFAHERWVARYWQLDAAARLETAAHLIMGPFALLSKADPSAIGRGATQPFVFLPERLPLPPFALEEPPSPLPTSKKG